MFGTASNAVASHRGVSHKALLKVLFLLALTLIHSQPLRRWLKLGHSKKGHQPFMFKHLCDCIMTKRRRQWNSNLLTMNKYFHTIQIYRAKYFSFYSDYMTLKFQSMKQEKSVQYNCFPINLVEWANLWEWETSCGWAMIGKPYEIG